MNQSDAQTMQYPTPELPSEGNGSPFYQPSPNQDPTELNLTAQLSRAIAPTMVSGPPNMNAVGGGNIPDGHDRGQPVHHSMSPPHQQYNPHMEQQQQPMQMAPMAGQYPMGDDGRERKRSKVSRACDECRRKKVRCDASEEQAGGQPCTNCKRTGIPCQFRREPQKRGPSKGYIKELADRLQSLESRVADDAPPITASYPYRHDSTELPITGQELGRKRQHESGDFGATSYHPASWTSQQQQQGPATTQFQSPHPSFSNPATNSLHPQPRQWTQPPATLQHQGSSFDGLPPSDGIDFRVHIDERALQIFYKSIYPTYPILSNTDIAINDRITDCPPALQTAFHYAFSAAVASMPLSHLHTAPDPRSTEYATQYIATTMYDDPSSRDRSANLVLLQTVLLLVVEAGNRLPDSTAGPGCMAYASLLSIAVSLAYSLKLHETQPISGLQNESDPAQEELRLARSIWWSLIIMDRWHAMSTATPVLIQDEVVVVVPQDELLLTAKLYHLARLSIVIGHLSTVNQARRSDFPPSGVSPSALHHTLLRGELDRCREAFPLGFFDAENAPLIHLFFPCAQILMCLMAPEYDPKELLGLTSQLVRELQRNTDLICPLIRYATYLVVSALIGLRSHEDTRLDAENNLETLLEAPIMPSAWDDMLKEQIRNNKRSEPYGSVGDADGSLQNHYAKTASRSLQHLAELATEKAAANEMGAEIDEPRFHELQRAIKEGYINKSSA